jgi:small conductance mechanosensitive channel
MLSVVLLRILFLGQMMLGPAAALAAPATEPAPATQPAAVEKASEPSSLVQVLEGTAWGKLVSGEKRISPEDLGHLEFWVTLVRDPLMAFLGFIPRLFVALIFLLIFWLVHRAARRFVLGGMKRARVDSSITDMLGHLIKWTILGFGAVIACNQIGVQITALLTGVSLIGLAVGFAAQETLANFIAGIVIFWDAPFKVGDWLEIGGTLGKVQRITFRSTRMLNYDGEMIIFPNTQMLNQRVANHSAHPANRLNIAIGIAYKESIDEARSVLLALTTHDLRICKDPPPCVVVKECADSSVNLILRIWILDEADEEILFHDYMEKAKKALDAAHIEIPFPHRQLLLDQASTLSTRLDPPPAHKAA